MNSRNLTATALAIALAAGNAAPAFADGAASTRNILLGGAAAAAGTLLIINHNKQVHQHYADDARRQADAQAQASNAQAAYAAERRAYQNEVAVNSEYKHEVATQHSLIESLRRTVAIEKTRADRAQTQARTQQRPASGPSAVAINAGAPVATTNAGQAAPAIRVASSSWGWGQL